MARIALYLLVSSLFVGTPGNLRAALTLQNYSPAAHDRFANDPGFIGNPHDWSGVGRSNIAVDTSMPADGIPDAMAYSWLTMISPSFGLSAWHLRPSVGGTASFFSGNDPSSTPLVRSVISSTQISGSDLALIRLDSPATGINFYPILDLPSASDYLNLEIHTFGLSNTALAQNPGNFADPSVVNSHLTNMRLGRNNIDGLIANFSDPGLSGSGDVLVFDFDATGGTGADESRVSSGDSGSSSFALTNQGPALVGIHWFLYTGETLLGDATTGSGDTFVPSFIGALNSSMASFGSSERVSTITAVPEPTSWAICFVLHGCAFYRRRRPHAA